MWKTDLSKFVASGRYRTQGSLVRALVAAGHAVTQSSVSRELAGQKVRKVGGYYVPSVQGGLPPGVRVHRVQVSAGGPIVVLHTQSAVAPRLAQAVDLAGLPGVLGTLAGDDTVFVACAPGVDLSLLHRFVGVAQEGEEA